MKVKQNDSLIENENDSFLSSIFVILLTFIIYQSEKRNSKILQRV